ncbi:uncharacterized protein N0V89_006797 [Didymosphaeria variabile]|uniref:Uncharacterized protein n=1 Tax=Didymosphaeria variabile TaxID=1932322 RepID=A0A9W8XK90_9PLEO|nr:uncharacterized protein N0V89_006797 [Didymosphaeria variabile]KAJ4351455.1 hypothetical protein N0V89_006797 [Didymosphaeria variabile]
MKTSLVLLPALAALGFTAPVEQAPQPPVTCTGNQKENILVSHDYNFTPTSDTYEICNGECFNVPAEYNNSISAIDPNDHTAQTCTLYDLPNCERIGGEGYVLIGNDRVNDLRTLSPAQPNLDKKVSSILCTWTN